MKSKRILTLAAVACVGALLGAGCDWSAGGSSLNTSQGAGLNINFSGVYNGNIGGRAVDRTSAGTIDRLTIRQTGNRVEVVDSQGSRYEGSVGSPGIVSQAGASGRFPSGAELVQAQISWTGRDGVAAKDVEFVGIIHAVSVNEIEGSSTITKDEDSREESDNYTYKKSTRVTTNAILGETITETTAAYDGDGNLVYLLETTTTVPAYGGDATTTERVIVDNRKETSSTVSSSETTFKLTEANVQYRLEGTWIEKDSPIVSRVDALSRGTFGIITIATRGAQEGGIGTDSGGGTTTTTTE